MALIDIQNGDLTDANPVMANFNAVGKILTIDATTDLNASASSGSSTLVTQNKDKTYSFTPAQINRADYIVLEILGDFRWKVGSGSSSSAAYTDTHLTLIIETTNPTAATLFNKKILENLSISSGSGEIEDAWGYKTFKYIHTLTNDEKTNGLDIKISVNAQARGATSASGLCSFTNQQIVFSNGY